MNREILFRGKLLAGNKKGEWTEGCLKIWPNKEMDILPDDTVRGIYGAVDPATVGQYTGLLDKNGEKIFEGDILRTREWEGRKEAVVIFESGMFKAHGMSLVTWTINPGIYNCEIIGNIHDNPELLQEAWSKR